VQPTSQSPSRLSGSAVAAIVVVSVFAGLGVVAVITAYFVKRHTKREGTHKDDEIKMKKLELQSPTFMSPNKLGLSKHIENDVEERVELGFSPDRIQMTDISPKVTSDNDRRHRKVIMPQEL